MAEQFPNQDLIDRVNDFFGDAPFEDVTDRGWSEDPPDSRGRKTVVVETRTREVEALGSSWLLSDTRATLQVGVGHLVVEHVISVDSLDDDQPAWLINADTGQLGSDDLSSMQGDPREFFEGFLTEIAPQE